MRRRRRRKKMTRSMRAWNLIGGNKNKNEIKGEADSL